MANTWNQVGTLRGPQGERGAAYGGTWVMRPSQNGFIWERTA